MIKIPFTAVLYVCFSKSDNNSEIDHTIILQCFNGCYGLLLKGIANDGQIWSKLLTFYNKHNTIR